MSLTRFLWCIHRQQQLAPAMILHYDSTMRDLRIWFWYVATVHSL